MTRPIVWALGVAGVAVLTSVGTADRIAARFGQAGPTAANTAGALSTAAVGTGTARTVSVAADWRGHFTVHPMIDGRRVRMMVDTGASLIALSHEDAQSIGLKVSQRDFTGRTHTANGIVEVAPVRLRDVRINDILVRDVEAVVLPPGKLGTSLLGMSFLRRIGGFEIARGQLTLRG